MSIQVTNLTKRYGAQLAIDTVSFEARKGEIVGFLGPNGAGKTTTMKILTCFIPATSGTASVCGFDTATASMEVRRRIGYLPEHNPLYKEMYVKEYLGFIAGLHQLSNPRAKIADMIERVGLGDEQRKQIGALSKGYRQRVGLAQALLHNPEVLILDEPTTGLDPNQLVEIRNLIRAVAAEKTVILSTHIMQEVEALCSRVLIINKGVLVANDTVATLRAERATQSIVRVEFSEAVKPATITELERVKGIGKVKALGANRYEVSAATTAPLDLDLRPLLATFATTKGYTILEMVREQRSVEDIFHTLTQNAGS